jgi:hypothetical protein
MARTCIAVCSRLQGIQHAYACFTSADPAQEAASTNVKRHEAIVLTLHFADGSFGNDLHSQGPAACFMQICNLRALACLGHGAALRFAHYGQCAS